MGAGWKRVDLDGGGLQAANLRLAAVLKRRCLAYGLLALFPLGLHRAYLEDRRGAWLYRAGAILCAAAFVTGPASAGWAVLAVLAAATVRDAFRIEDRLARINKRLRMAAWLGNGAAPPAGWRGRVVDETPAGGSPGTGDAGEEAQGRQRRHPTLAEQERMLARLARERRPPRGD